MKTPIARFRRKQIASSLVSIVFLALCFIGCSKSTDTTSESVTDSTSNTSQTAMSQAGSSASATESGSVGFLGNEAGGEALSSYESANYVDPDQVHPTATACTYSSVRGTCASSADTITWGSCTVDGGLVTMSGTWSETFSGTGASTCTTPISSGGSVTRTSSSSVMTFASGATLTTDTNGGTAWDGTTIPSTGETVSNSSGTRTIVINGIHRALKGPRGTTWFDHYITSTGLTATGSRAAGTRSISGSLKVYHGLLKYTATSTFNTVVWGSSTCCYPTSGNISSTLTGSLSGSTTLTFSSTCGSATYVDTSGTSSSLTLTHCS